jgi:hypothetical protein
MWRRRRAGLAEQVLNRVREFPGARVPAERAVSSLGVEMAQQDFAVPLNPRDAARYHLPRFPCFEDRSQFLALVTGVERGKRALRRWLGH